MQFAVIGNPVAHSLSPILHNSAFLRLGIDGFYGRYLLENAKDFMGLKKLNLQGANVTVPYKEVAFNACDEVFGIAKEIKAVNTLVFKENKIFGYNTDAPGFYECIESFDFKKALIIGAGGSAKALACILREKGFDIEIVNRSQGRLEDFKKQDFVCYEASAYIPKKYDIVINTTPAGLTQDSLPLEREKLVEVLKGCKLAFDLIYGKNTPFLNLAKELKIPSLDGKNMLINQAVLAFVIFMENFNRNFDRELLRKTMQSTI